LKKYIYFKGSRGEALQDSFVLSILGGKRNGFYLEIGSAGPEIANNTFLLEKSFNWNGISIEFNPDLVDEFSQLRSNSCILADATKFDFLACLEENNFPEVIDFLQLDIDPAANTLLALKQIPFNKYRFSVVTFEHDLYRSADNIRVKSEAASILEKHGYIRIVDNLQVIPGVPENDGNWAPFEDWWIHKDMLKNYAFDIFENVPWISIFNTPISLKIKVVIKQIKKKIIFYTSYNKKIVANVVIRFSGRV